jgi:hypothetical protein
MYLDSMQELQQQKMRTSEREPLLEEAEEVEAREAEEEVEEANTEVEKETRKNQEIPLQREVEEVNLENNWLTMTSPH